MTLFKPFSDFFGGGGTNPKADSDIIKSSIVEIPKIQCEYLLKLSDLLSPQTETGVVYYMCCFDFCSAIKSYQLVERQKMAVLLKRRLV